MAISTEEAENIGKRIGQRIISNYERCEDLVTLLDDGVVWLEIAEDIKDMELVSRLKGLENLDHCFLMERAIECALGALDTAARPGEEFHRGYISNEEYAEAEKLIEPLKKACRLPSGESRALFSKAIKHTRQLMATRSCKCLIEEEQWQSQEKK